MSSSPEEDFDAYLSQIFTEEAFQLEEDTRYELFEYVAQAQLTTSSLILPGPAAGLDINKCFRIPSPLYQKQKNFVILGIAHAIDEMEFQDIPRVEWINLHPSYAEDVRCRNFKAAHKLQDTSIMTVVSLLPASFALFQENTLTPLVHDVPLAMYPH